MPNLGPEEDWIGKELKSGQKERGRDKRHEERRPERGK